MELDIQTLPCGCITETNKSEKEPKPVLRRTCDQHSGQGGIVSSEGSGISEEPIQEPIQKEERASSFWIYVGVAVILVIAIAYYAFSTYGLSLDLFKDISIPGLSGTVTSSSL